MGRRKDYVLQALVFLEVCEIFNGIESSAY